MEMPGIGYMIKQLSGNETVNAYRNSLGREITSMRLDKEANGGDGIFFITFADASILTASDGGRSCCEHRYMVCDDDLSFVEGARLLDIQLLSGPELYEHGEPHETQFLKFLTDKGNVVVSNHNEHNGYYGGISLCLALESREQA